MKKYILKDIAYDYIPRKLLDRSKMGFSIPVADWLRGPLSEKLRGYGDYGFLKAQDIFDAGYVSRLVEDFIKNGDAGDWTGRNPSAFVWFFFVFQQWCEAYM